MALWDGKLSAGAAKGVLEGSADHWKPAIFQVMTSRRVNGGTQGQPQKAERLRLNLSDGLTAVAAVLATQLNGQFMNQNLEKCIVKLNEFTVSTVTGSQPAQPGKQGTNKLLLITGMEVLAPAQPVIGNPRQDPANAAPTAPKQAAPAVPKPMAKPIAPPAAPTRTLSAPQARNHPPASIDHQRIAPIKSLNPYSTNNWCIKARVTSKSDVRTYQSQKNGSSGKLFSVDLVDADGGEIRATAFNQTVDQLEPMLEVGKVYYISRGDVKQANKKFSKSINNDYEITFNHNTAVEKAEEADEDAIPMQQFHFTDIKDLPAVGVNEFCDVIGVVLDLQDIAQINTKNGLAQKRTITIGDQSKSSIQLSLWGKLAEATTELSPGQVIAIKGAKISDFGGLSLTSLASSHLDLNGDSPDAHRLKGWYDTDGHSVAWTQLSTGGRFRRTGEFGGEGGADAGGGQNFGPAKWLTFAEVAKLGPESKEAFFSYATVSHIKHDGPSLWSYPACPAPKCGKKVTNVGGSWECQKCNTTYPECQRRYMLQTALLDYTGQVYVSLFNEGGEKVLGKTAGELVAMQESGAPDQLVQLDHTFQDALFRTWKMKLLAKFEDYQGKSRLKVSALAVDKCDYAEATRYFLDRFNQLAAQQ